MFATSSPGLWVTFFHYEGSVLLAALPYCIVNCISLGLVAYFNDYIKIGFSATGHGLMTLLVSYLVISKVNLAYDRYMACRCAVGAYLMHLRELLQLVVAVSCVQDMQNDGEARRSQLRVWRSECVALVLELMDCTKTVIQSEELAKHFARNKALKDPSAATRAVDPLALSQRLRLHLFCSSYSLTLELLERVTLINKLQDFTTTYHRLLELASTPLPLPLVQMGRAFLFLWTFTMPLVLQQGPFTDLTAAMLFLFFLTYGFIGLELVSIMLIFPFGDGVNDLQVTKMRDATVAGIELDLEQSEYDDCGTRTDQLSQGQRFKTNKRQSATGSGGGKGNDNALDTGVYHAMSSHTGH